MAHFYGPIAVIQHPPLSIRQRNVITKRRCINITGMPPIPATMSASVRRLIAYYQSPEFAKDHANLVCFDPRAARKQRQTIIDHMNENFATVGMMPSATDLAVQAEFIAGVLPLPQMLEHMEQYVESIKLRWPEEDSSEGP